MKFNRFTQVIKTITNSKRRAMLVAVLLGFMITIVMPLWHPEPVGAIAIRSTPTEANSGGVNVNSFNINKPASVVAGDVLVAVVGVDLNNIAITASGWTLIHHSFNTNLSVDTFYRVLNGSEGASFNFSWVTTSRAAGGIVAYKGVDGTTPLDVTGTNNAGNSNSITALGVTTVTDGAMVIAGYGLDRTAVTTFTPSGMTERVDEGSSHGSFNDVSVGLAEVVQPVAGASGDKTIGASGSGPWDSSPFALRPEIPGVNQSSYRFLSNLDAANSEFIVDNITANDDTIRGLAVDSVNGFMYIGGFDATPNWLVQKRSIIDGSEDTGFTAPSLPSGNVGGLAIDPGGSAIFLAGNSGGVWRIEKRRMSDGALCTAGNCGTAFDTDGVLSPGVTGSLNSVDIDTVNGFIYVAGFDTASGNTTRIGKYSTSTGAASAGFTQTGGSPVCSSISGTACYNVTSGDDRLRTVSVDPQNGYVYAGGWDSSPGNLQWHMQKRRTSDGALCTAANCGTAFDTDGIYQYNSAGSDQALTFQVDTPGNAIYVGGVEGVSANRWRLEKLAADTGARVTTFGNLGGDPCATAGVVCYNSAGDDQLLDLDLDDAGGFVYITGQDDPSDMHWRIEKRLRSTGALETTFGGTDAVCATAGVVCVDPSANDDQPAWIAVDLARNLLYTSGGDRSPGASNQQWRIQKFDLDNGGIWLGAEDTAAVASTDISFRLRLLLHVTDEDMITNGTHYKLQYATKVGTCDTGFVDEIYADVTSSTNEIRYHDNPSLTDASAVVAITGDPTHGGDTVTLQTYEELNNFTNPTNDVLNGQDGKWEFSLKDFNAFGAYCFRVVQSDDTQLDTYTVVPEISFCRNDPKTENLLRHGTYFCSGTKRAFFWAKD